MSEILFQYQKVAPTTWAYLASLLIIGLYFKFNRFWSVRNLDLCLVILLAPGLLFVYYGEQLSRKPAVAAAAPAVTPAEPAIEPVPPVNDSSATDGNVQVPADNPSTAATPDGAPITEPAKPEEPKVKPIPVANTNLQPPREELLASMPKLSPEKAVSVMNFGYVWLLSVSLLLLIRLLCDPTMVRRPLLEPNLSNGGLLFIGCALLVFLMANVLASEVSTDDLSGPQGAAALMQKRDDGTTKYTYLGPGYYFLHLLPSIPTLPAGGIAKSDPRLAFAPAAKTMAIISHLAVVIALVIVGLWHFDNIKLGIGAAAMYLMLPYTAQMTGHVDHVLPSALMLWAVVFYRRPAIAGIFVGLSVGVVYYPIFLLPLWISFYWQRGVFRFLAGLLGAIAITAISLAFVSEDMASFWSKIRQMFGLFMPNMDAEKLRGIWGQTFGWDPIWRLPCIAVSICISALFALWPAQKNLGTLLSCSAAMMLAVQFWHGYGGGTYIAWFMPLMLLTIFRPNLEDRIALTVLGEGWLSKRRTRLAPLGRAA
ncbi:hypothetical protein [Anatilimnocola floriformis]|uniref:hypothetical protein n=1 Tax=Anatilimnocola floriformis TaxID=2948575 RepID=UPI0020C58D0D|nr:hypothetical protein [Anatilimnocola floriformis]